MCLQTTEPNKGLNVICVFLSGGVDSNAYQRSQQVSEGNDKNI